MSENKEFPFGGMVASGFGMLILTLLIPVIIVASFVVLPEELYWIACIITALGVI